MRVLSTVITAAALPFTSAKKEDIVTGAASLETVVEDKTPTMRNGDITIPLNAELPFTTTRVTLLLENGAVDNVVEASPEAVDNIPKSMSARMGAFMKTGKGRAAAVVAITAALLAVGGGVTGGVLANKNRKKKLNAAQDLNEPLTAARQD